MTFENNDGAIDKKAAEQGLGIDLVALGKEGVEKQVAQLPSELTQRFENNQMILAYMDDILSRVNRLPEEMRMTLLSSHKDSGPISDYLERWT